ncbi:Cellular retinoic acid-binding protein 1, partial [Nibea albiflora]
MPNFEGTWKMKSSHNFEELLKALGVNPMLRRVAVAAASKPHVEIKQNGEHFYIKTSTTVRTTEINFLVGEEFNEETVDGRKCKVKLCGIKETSLKVAAFLAELAHLGDRKQDLLQTDSTERERSKDLLEPRTQ